MGERDGRGDSISDCSREGIGYRRKGKRVVDIDEQYRVEFANKPGVTYQRFVDSWGQDDPEKYVRDFNRRSAR